MKYFIISHFVFILIKDFNLSTSIFFSLFFFRQEAYDIICHAVNVSNEDVVVFAENNRNSALEKLIHALQLTQPPIVFVGSSESHTLLLPWIEIGAKVNANTVLGALHSRTLLIFEILFHLHS